MSKSDIASSNGHRERLRQRFLRSGIEGLNDYETLELLLTYSIPRKDSKPLAKRLLAHYGKISSVFDSSFEKLLTVEGVGKNSAVLILLFRELMECYLKEKIHKKDFLSSPGDVIRYLGASMRGLKHEVFKVVFLSARNEVICNETIQEGIVDRSVVFPRKVIERALYHSACSLVLSHNHPSGSLRPSQADRRLTSELIKAAQVLDINVHDHIIISKEGYFSFQEHGLMV